MTSKIRNLPSIVEQGADGYCSFRKWSDGTLEQWGTASIPAVAGNSSTSVSLAIPYIDTNYAVVLTGGNNAGGSVILAENNYSNANRERTTSSFKVSAFKSGFAYYIGFSFYTIGRWK